MIAPQFFAVRDGVYCLRRPSYLNCSYVVTLDDGGLVFIDAGMRSDGADPLYAIERLGRQPRDVRAVLLTHWHGDHTAGAGRLQAASGARVWMGRGEEPWLLAAPRLNAWRRALDRWLPEIGPLLLARAHLGVSVPQLPAASCESVALGDDRLVLERFRAIPTPGHSDGHLAWLDERTGTLFCGDALAVVRGRVRLMAAPVTPDQPRARQSALALLEREWATLCPGHRRPLAAVSREERLALRDRVAAETTWPLLG